MARTFSRQETQIRNSDTYDDTIAPTEAAFETNPTHIEEDLNNIRSQMSNVLDVQASDWFVDINTPATLETGTQRGVNNLNTDLHALEKKRVLRCVYGLKAITIAGAGDTFDILGTGQLPGNTTAAVGAVTTLGTVVADHNAAFGAHSLLEVAGLTAISPKNLLQIVDDNRDPVLDVGDKIYGLLQSETAADGHTITDTTTTRVQISFVKVNGAGTDLIAISAGAMDGVTYDYCYVERVRLEDLNEGDFLSGANVDVPAGTTVTRQAAYDNQGTTPVDQTTNATLDLEGAGLAWTIRDDLEAALITVTEGSAGGTSDFTIEAGVDTFNSDAIANSFNVGASFDDASAGTTINVGVTANQIDSGGALTMQSASAAILRMDAGGLLEFGDTNEVASTYDTPLVLSDTAAEWTAFDTAFGEVSLLSAIVTANTAGDPQTVFSNVIVAAAEDVDLSVSDSNLDTALGDLSLGTFISDYGWYYNGSRIRPAANAAGNNDIYPGTALNNGGDGQVKLEFKAKIGDVIAVDRFGV